MPLKNNCLESCNPYFIPLAGFISSVFPLYYYLAQSLSYAATEQP